MSDLWNKAKDLASEAAKTAAEKTAQAAEQASALANQALDATKDIETQQSEMRQLVSKALEHYRPKRGTYGKRTSVFWRRFAVPRSE